MERTPINPVSWSIKVGFDQAELIEGHQRLLVCSGQDAVNADGNFQHPDDMAAQLELAVDNLEAVLAAADMTLANIVRLNVYTTDFDELLKHWARLTDRFGNSDGGFATHPARGHAAIYTTASRLAGGNRGGLTRRHPFTRHAKGGRHWPPTRGARAPLTLLRRRAL
jgi:enamine deaminase RidA (YjgF/YER057c/UK114 family)